MSGQVTGGSAHQPLDGSDEPKEFKIQVLPAGSAPKKDTHQPDPNGELAPGQPNNSADTTYDNATEGSKTDVHKGLGDDGVSKEEKEEDRTTMEGHRAEMVSATEREPEGAESI